MSRWWVWIKKENKEQVASEDASGEPVWIPAWTGQKKQAAPWGAFKFEELRGVHLASTLIKKPRYKLFWFFKGVRILLLSLSTVTMCGA